MPLAFEDFVLDKEQFELRKGNFLLKVDAKLLNLLEFFLEHAGEAVSKQEILDQVWEGRMLSESILSVSVAKLRKVLGQKVGEREYIVTIYGRGYRFVPQVTFIPPTATKTSIPSGSSHDLVNNAPLVGRDSVIQRLNSILERACSGTGSICILVGEPGIGKTRVVHLLEE